MKIERQIVDLVSALPAEWETGIAVGFAGAFGTITAFPGLAREKLSDAPVYGRLFDVMSDLNLSRTAGALTIMFGVLAFDGAKKLISKRTDSAE